MRWIFFIGCADVVFRTSWSIDGMRSLFQRSLNTVAKRLLQESKLAFISNTITV